MRVVLTDCDHGFVDPERAAVEAGGHELVVADCSSEDDVIAAAAEADAIICQAAPIGVRVLESLPRLRVVGRYGTGLDTVDLDAAERSDVTVVHTPGFCTEEVADHTLALLLALARGLPANTMGPANAEIADDYPARIDRLQGVAPLSETTVGVVGFGRIGQEVARRLLALRCTVLAHDPHLPDQVATDLGAASRPLDELLAQSDFVTLHMPATPETSGLIDAEAIATMKPGARLINVSRGELVDEAALVEALHDGHLGGAGLDVTLDEPTPLDHPLLSLRNVIVTPHVAFYSERSLADVKQRIARYVVNALAGEGEYVAAAGPSSSRSPSC